jgi:hypothetical protein
MKEKIIFLLKSFGIWKLFCIFATDFEDEHSYG